MVCRPENIIVPAFVNKPLPELYGVLFEFLRNKHFVRKCRERQVEVVRQLAVLQFGRLGQTIPDFLHVRRQCSLKVG